jgi:GNAT superfamily N-acetyltransferase
MATWKVRVASAADHDAILSQMLKIQSETEGFKSAGFGRPMWEWQYLRHKHGSLVVIAEDQGAVCGYFHLLLFDMRCRDRSVIGAVIQDTATMASHRRQGIFGAMDVYALEQLRQRGIHVVYGFANDRSLPGYKRNPAYTIMTRLPVYVCPMDVGGVLADHLHLGGLGKAVGRLTMPLYRALRVRTPRLNQGEEVVQLSQFDDEVEPVARAFADLTRFGIDRTTDFLNWRFLEKPSRDYTIWGLRRDGHLRAYVVTRVSTLFSTECIIFMDFGCAREDQPALLRLIATRLAAERKAGAGLGVTQGLHPFFTQLRTLGFVRVPERFVPSPLHFFASGLDPDISSEVVDPTNWLITLADWDVL